MLMYLISSGKKKDITSAMAQQTITIQTEAGDRQWEPEIPVQNLVSYWKLELAKAMKAGDAQQVEKVQNKLLDAMQRARM